MLHKKVLEKMSIFQIAAVLYTLVTWIINVIKITRCDWQLAVAYKEEVIHILGLIPGVCWVTAWT